ncbi:MAG: hypothetical protein AB7V25_00365 [Mangrovibacterium sp.]
MNEIITLTISELKQILQDAAELGAADYAKTQVVGNDFISQAKSYREFGEGRVRGWKKMGLVHPVRNGKTINSKIIYSRSELLSVEKAERLQQMIAKP